MKGFIYSDQMALMGHRDIVGFGDDVFRVMLWDCAKARDYIKTNHYSGTFVANSTHHFKVEINGAMVGVLQFGHPMNPASGPSVVRDAKPGSYLELNRMHLQDVAPKNSESQAIAACIKVLRALNRRLEWVQSFADERCGRNGIVYQAANFLFCGSHTSTFWELDGEVFHNIEMTANESKARRPAARALQERKAEAKRFELRQFRYILPLHRSVRGRLLLNVSAYPKHYQTAVAP